MTLILNNAKFISHLSLHSSITSDEVASIKYPLPGSNLKTLSLCGNPMGDEGFNHLLFYLDTLPSLQYLHLQNCGITEASIPSLTSYISRSLSLYASFARIASLIERSEHRRRSSLRRDPRRAPPHHRLQPLLRPLHQPLLAVEFHRILHNQVGNGHRIDVGRFSDSTFSRTKQTFGLLENPPSSLLDHRFHLPVSTHSRGYS